MKKMKGPHSIESWLLCLLHIFCFILFYEQMKHNRHIVSYCSINVFAGIMRENNEVVFIWDSLDWNALLMRFSKPILHKAIVITANIMLIVGRVMVFWKEIIIQVVSNALKINHHCCELSIPVQKVDSTRP